MLYQVAIKKMFEPGWGDPRPWVNTYHCDVADLEAALTVAQNIMAVEQNVHWNNVHFIQLAARQVDVSGVPGRQRAVNQLGERDAEGEDFIPAFCTVRVTLSDGVNRPDQKYLRLPINENESGNGVLDTSLIAFVGAGYLLPIQAVAGVVSSDGVPYTGGTIYNQVQNRQRGWHRRTRPGMKRGWVPA